MLKYHKTRHCTLRLFLSLREVDVSRTSANLDMITYLCFFIFFLRFLFVLSILIPAGTGGAGSFTSCKPKRVRASSHSERFPTRFITSARLNCLAASASASGVAIGGSSIVPKDVGGEGNSDEETDVGWFSGADSKRAVVGWCSNRHGLCSAKNRCKTSSFGFTVG